MPVVCRVNLLLISLWVICFIFLYVSAENEKERPVITMIRNSLLMTARGCMSNVHAKESDLEHLRKDPPYPEKTACVIKCLAEKMKMIKGKKFSKEGFLALVTPMVMGNKTKMEHMRDVAEACDKEIKPQDSCQLGNDMVICIYKYAPELHLKQ